MPVSSNRSWWRHGLVGATAACLIATAYSAGCSSPSDSATGGVADGGGDATSTCPSGACPGGRTGQTGEPCGKNADCPDDICLPVGGPSGGDAGWTGNVCTTPCSGPNDCVPGWTCGALIGQPTNVCQCHYSPEVCDGLDNDCDGIVDDGNADQTCLTTAGAGHVCRNGTCTCPATCGGQCVDTSSDPANCGSCGHACPVDCDGQQACQAGACVSANLDAGSGGTCLCSPMPSNPNAPPPPATGPLVFAVSKLYLGDTDRSGVSSSSAWQFFGYDLDRAVTTKSSTNTCQLASGASKLTQVDGNCGGNDNSWGENVLPIILSTSGSDLSSKINAALSSGGETLLVRVDANGVNDASGISGAVLGGAPLGHAPAYDGSDSWPIDSRSVSGSPSSPNATFVGGWISGGTYVSGNASGEMTLYLGIGAQVLPLDVRNAIISMNLSSDGKHATNGTIAGVIPTMELVNALQAVAGSISLSLCSGAAFQSIAQTIEQAQDILLDETNNPTMPCDGISVGIGFDAEAVQIGALQQVNDPPNPCAD